MRSERREGETEGETEKAMIHKGKGEKEKAMSHKGKGEKENAMSHKGKRPLLLGKVGLRGGGRSSAL